MSVMKLMSGREMFVETTQLGTTKVKLVDPEKVTTTEMKKAINFNTSVDNLLQLIYKTRPEIVRIDMKHTGVMLAEKIEEELTNAGMKLHMYNSDADVKDFVKKEW